MEILTLIPRRTEQAPQCRGQNSEDLRGKWCQSCFTFQKHTCDVTRGHLRMHTCVCAHSHGQGPGFCQREIRTPTTPVVGSGVGRRPHGPHAFPCTWEPSKSLRGLKGKPSSDRDSATWSGTWAWLTAGMLVTIHNLPPTVAWFGPSSAQVPAPLHCSPTCRPSGREGARWACPGSGRVQEVGVAVP